MPKPKLTPFEVLLSRISPEPTSGCWLWLGPYNSDGYGVIPFGGKGDRRTFQAHRVSYAGHKGEIPDGLVIDHLCRMPCCVNPAHLEAVTMRTNTIRGIRPAQLRAEKLAKTHCPNGHEYGEDTYIRKISRGINNFTRRCRICTLAANEASVERRK